MSKYMYRSNNRGPGHECPTLFAHASLGALVLFLFALAPHALAAPVHSPLPGLSLDGKNKTVAPKEFNKACGATVDSKGDVYVASAGNSTVDVFDSEHNYLTSISNANKPCGLAVDSKGSLYVSESKTGKVVKYTPSPYPFSGIPAYGPPTTIDASGNAKGISVDPTDDHLYVAEGNRIDSYNPDGSLGIDEVQRVFPLNATGGTYKLSFLGQETASLPYEATHAEVQTALTALSTIGSPNVVVTQGPNASGRDHLITFTGALAKTNVEPIVCNKSGLTGPSASCFTATQTDGFSGHIGEGFLTNATGVAVYTYGSGEKKDRYLFAADAASDQIEVFGGSDIRNLKLRKTIKGPKAGEDFGFGAAGAYLAVDPGNGDPGTKKCSPVAEQACTAGHFLVYDDAHEAVDEFEASGRYLTQISKTQLTEAEPGFADAQPTAIAVDRSGGLHDGTIYVSAGAGPGAKLLAFGPLAAPGRPPLPEPLSHVLESAQAVATDSAGDVYVAAAIKISVYDPAGAKLTEFEDAELGVNRDLAVDSTGKLYVLEKGKQVTYYTPAVYPPVQGTGYTRHEPPCATLGSFSRHKIGEVESIGINPTNDHVFVSAREQNQIIELNSAANGCATLNPDFAASFLNGIPLEIAAYGANGDVYISGNNQTIVELNPGGTEILARISGTGSPKGQFGGGNPGSIAVDQSNGHVLVFNNTRGVAEEYDASGAFVAQFGEFTTAFAGPSRIAIDNSGGPTDGNVYVAYDDPAPETFDLTAFGPLAYGEPPIAVTGAASGLGGGNATLNGTIDPRGFDLTECKFEYLTDAKYQENLEAEDPAFENAEEEACIPGLAEIGKGAKPAPVHADLSGLDPEGRYRFRLYAKNAYGDSEGGEAGLFGPPLITTMSALPVLYDEATLRAEVDPSGLATKYHFEYGKEGAGEYDQSTPTVELAAGDGKVAVQAALAGLAEGTEYHFRIVAENEAGAVPGPGQGDQTLLTLERRPLESCANAEFRTGRSVGLPDCRAYELVTPADTRGSYPYAADTGTPGRGFNNWLVMPRGEGAGESLAYFLDTTLPGFDGTGRLDGYHAQRVTDEGPHPKEGWKSELFGPSYQQTGGGTPRQHGVAADQRYSLWEVRFLEAFEGTLPQGVYLRTPGGFEPVGQGSLGADLKAESRYVSGGGDHVVFSSKEQLEPEAPPKGTEAVYDRAAGDPTSHVVSLLPGDVTPVDDSRYTGTTEDGSTTLFANGGRLYARLDNSKTIGVPDLRLGDTVACTTGPGGPALSYQWLRNGAPIPAATNSSYPTVAADAGTLVQCQVTATNVEGGSLKTSTPLAVAPFPSVAPPRVIGNPTITGTGNVGQTLTCDPGTWEGNPAFAFQWYRNGAPIASASALTYLLSGADKGAAVQCGLTATSPGGAAIAFTARTFVSALPPAANANPAISGTPAVGQVLSCENGTWTNSPSFSYEWLRNGAPIPAATASTYTVVAADEGKVLQCRLSATNPDATAKAVSANAVIPPAPGTAPPSLTAVGSVNGTATVGQTLSCESGTWTNSPTFAYQWLRNGVPIATATAGTYTLVAADRQTTIQCQVTATNAAAAAVAINAGAGARYVDPNPPVATASVPKPAFTFAGISADGKRVFYAGAELAPQATQPADLFALDLETQAGTEIAKDSIFVNVSADGSHVYFTSKEVLDQAAEGTPGANNLYLWDGAGTRFVALLDPKDLVSFEAGGIEGLVNLRRWAEVIGPPGAVNGRGYSPTRSTPNGEVLVFESHARLTSYDNTEAGAGACGDPKQAGDRCVEVYRYDAAAALGERLSCVSCDPSGAPPSADARLETLGFGKVVHNTTLIANLTENGGAVFFESRDRLLPEDANSVQDVYEWKAPGEGCKRAVGCLALISSGQSEQNSFLYSAGADGHDVFFTTLEKLVGADVTGSPSIYDARVDGGIPNPPAAAPCQGDACQGQGSPPPALPSPASTGSGDGNIPKEGPSACRKGKHRVKGRCVKKHHKPGRHHKRSQHRANHKWRAAR